MSVVTLAGEADFETWRAAARRLASGGARPETIIWKTPEAETDLFTEPEPVAPAPSPSGEVRAPRDFIEMARLVVCHRETDRYDLLYRILLRLQVEADLWNRVIDCDIYRLREMARAVRRDRHKMTAFVRFREVATHEGAAYIAWFEPSHHIVELAAPFFVERFAAMRWSILTPERSAHWTGATLVFGAGAAKAQAPTQDALEEVWRTYYASIFNPARLKPAAMQREMPKKYWANLPEASLIGDLMRSASAKENEMIASPAAKPHRRAAAVLGRRKTENPASPPRNSLDEVRHEAAHCERCPLFKNATQTVFGEGSGGARLVFVGEQPGDSEDLAGKPFIGPAGQMFDRALAEAGIDRKDAYVTNAVKHFKYEPRGKRRIHQKPTAGEIDVCRWWLDQELALIKPRLAVALGATAARGLTGKSIPVMASRGKVLPGHAVEQVFVTVHPSMLLRLPDAESKEREWAAFVRDLVKVRKLMEAA